METASFKLLEWILSWYELLQHITQAEALSLYIPLFNACVISDHVQYFVIAVDFSS